MAELLVRIAWALGIGFFGFCAYWAISALVLRRLRKPASGLEELHPGMPAILYFSTPNCQPCKTLQRPALKRLFEDLGHQVKVIQIDATQRPDLADYWGVLSVPTTFIIDSKGQPRGVNHGVAPAEKLRRQLEAAEGRPLTTRTKASQAIHSPVIERK